MTNATGRRSLACCGGSVSPGRDGPPEDCSTPSYAQSAVLHWASIDAIFG